MSQASDCVACPAGSFCSGSSNTDPTGNCTAGYFCAQELDSNGRATKGSRNAQGALDNVPTPSPA